MLVNRYTPYSARVVRMAFRHNRPVGTVEVWRDGRKVGLARIGQGTSGKEVHYEFKAWSDECRFRRHISRLPMGFFAEIPVDADSSMALFLIELADDAFVRQQLAVACHGQTLFHLRGDRDDEWRSVAVPYKPEIAAALRCAYGIRLDGIANEEIAEVSDGKKRAIKGALRLPQAA